MPARTTRSASSSARVVDVSVQPRTATMPSRASIPTASRSVGADLTAAGHEARIDRRGGAYHGPRNAEFQRFPEQVQRPEAAAELKPRAARHPVDEGPDRGVSCRRCRRRDPDPPRESTARPGSTNRSATADGIVPINGLPRRLALAQANDAAASNVDGGKEIHYRALRQPPLEVQPLPSDRVGLAGPVGAEQRQQAVALLLERRALAPADRAPFAHLDPPGVLGHAVHPELVVQVRTAGQAGGADVPDDLSLLDPGPRRIPRAKPRRCP